MTEPDHYLNPGFNEEGPINFRKYLYEILKNWYWFLITIGIALFVAYSINRYNLPLNIATSTLLVEQDESRNDIMTEFRAIRYLRRKADLANEIAKLNALDLHMRVIDSLGWDIEWTGHGRLFRERPLYKQDPFQIVIDSSSSQWYLNRSFFINYTEEGDILLSDNNNLEETFPVDSWVSLHNWKFKIVPGESSRSYSSYSFIINSRDHLAHKQRSKASYSTDEGESMTLRISSQGPIFEKERDYVNMLCEIFIQSTLERKRRIAENTLLFVESQLEIIQDSLRQVEDQMLKFQISNEIIDLSKEGQIAYSQMDNFYQKRLELDLQNNYLEYLIDYINNNKNPEALIAPALMQVRDPVLEESVKKLKEAQEQRDRLNAVVESNTPALIQINKRISKEKDFILEVTRELVENNNLAKKQIEIREEAVEERMLELPGNEQELINIQRKYDVNNSFLTFLMERRAEAGIEKASTVSSIRILNHSSYYNMNVINNNRTQVYVVSFFIALLLPILIIVAVDLIDQRIREKSDIDRKTSIPILGVLAHFKGSSNLAVLDQPRSSLAESFRRLRTEIYFDTGQVDGKVVLVTSAISGEGKTFTAINLASIMAIGNKKTLLLGLDLRKPSIHKIFKYENDTGISSYLEGKDSISNIIRPSEIDNLSIAYSGPIPPNPSELVEKKELTEFFQWARKEFDYIIIDTPPLALVPDAMLIADHSDMNLFVIRYNYSRKQVLSLINRLNEKSRFKELKIIVNDLRITRYLGYGYEYGYGYAYGYGYGYYNKSYYSEG